MSTAVISVRVRRELEEEAKRLGIDIKSVVEEALEKEIRKVKIERLKRLLDEALKSMNLSVEEWVNAVKESRYGR